MMILVVDESFVGQIAGSCPRTHHHRPNPRYSEVVLKWIEECVEELEATFFCGVHSGVL